MKILSVTELIANFRQQYNQSFQQLTAEREQLAQQFQQHTQHYQRQAQELVNQVRQSMRQLFPVWNIQSDMSLSCS